MLFFEKRVFLFAESISLGMSITTAETKDKAFEEFKTKLRMKKCFAEYCEKLQGDFKSKT